MLRVGAAQISIYLWAYWFEGPPSQPHITSIRLVPFLWEERVVFSVQIRVSGDRIYRVVFATKHSIPYASSPVTKIRSYVFCSNNEASDEDRKIYVSFLRYEFSGNVFDRDRDIRRLFLSRYSFGNGETWFGNGESFIITTHYCFYATVVWIYFFLKDCCPLFAD